MRELLAKCGIDCGACPWGPYPRQGMSEEEFESYRSSARRVLGGVPTRTPCVTCQTPDSEIPKGSRIPDRKCRIRLCVDRSGLPNCACCARFPCDALKATVVWTREGIEAKLGAPISDEEYRCFVEPFQSTGRLQAIRAALKPEEIVEPARVAAPEARAVAFPAGLPFPEDEIAAFRAVHDLLSSIHRSPLGLRDADTFAQVDRLEGRRAHVLRFIWILVSYGELQNERTAQLVVDPKTYLANRGTEKTLVVWPLVRDVVFGVLAQFGVSCERVPLEGAREEDLTTGNGYLRKRGWVMKTSFDERAGGAAAPKALQSYAKMLEEEHGKKAFKHFCEADMAVLSG